MWSPSAIISIEFREDLVPVTPHDMEGSLPQGWAFRKLDRAALDLHLEFSEWFPLPAESSAAQAANVLTDYLESACNSCMPSRLASNTGDR
jgi:hypothetical protein